MSDEKLDGEPVDITSTGDTVPKKPQFLPSVFEQIEAMREENTLVQEEKKEEKKEEVLELEDEDVADIVAFPFDIAAMITRCKTLELSEQQIARLTRLYKRPLKRALGGIKNMDWYLAGLATMTILTDKTLDYMEFREKKEESKPKR